MTDVGHCFLLSVDAVGLESSSRVTQTGDDNWFNDVAVSVSIDGGTTDSFSRNSDVAVDIEGVGDNWTIGGVARDVSS